MARHVVPVPAGRRIERSYRANVLGADRAVRRLRPAEIAVLDIGARAVVGERGAGAVAEQKLRETRARGPWTRITGRSIS